MTRALIVGSGSIAVRHGEVLIGLDANIAFVTSRSIDGHVSFENLSSGLAEFQPDYVIVANETFKHDQVVRELISFGYEGAVLVEKPAQISEEVLRNHHFEKFAVAFNLRFHPILKALREVLSGQPILFVEAYAGQDLQTWRPERNVQSQYSAHANQGGGVLRDLSHELDYLMWLCGDVIDVVAVGGRIGKKTVDSDDSWSIIMTTELVPQISLQLNYFDTPATRFIHVQTENDSFHADLIGGALSRNGHEEMVFQGARNITYELMHGDMLSRSQTGTTIEEALKVDSLILDIERSAKQKAWVRR